RAVFGDGPHHCRQKGGDIAAVAVKKANDVAFGVHRTQSRRAGPTITGLRLADHARTRGCSPLGSPVGRTVVHHDNLVDVLREDFAHDICDRCFFIETWNDDADKTCAGIETHAKLAPTSSGASG